jgi:hypothetical protein
MNIDRLERILTMVYVVPSYWACFGLYPSFKRRVNTGSIPVTQIDLKGF